MNEAQNVRSSMPQLTERQTRTGAHNGGYLELGMREALLGLGFCVIDMSLT
jgi:hypothetical protein